MSETVPFTREELHLLDCTKEAGHERREKTGSGIWICELETVTPLCIQSYFSKLTDKDPAYIPGSSIRGMVRNVVEVLGAGCGRHYAEGYGVPRHLATCTETKSCLACRMFGFVDGNFSWAGKVRFNDTDPAPAGWVKYRMPNQRGGQNEEAGAGWIVFPHSMPSLDPGPTRCVGVGKKFRFRAEYLNLDAEEYALFKFALTLSHGGVELFHKMGYAKSLGLGSCRIRILNDKSPAIGPEIDHYLKQPGFGYFRKYRSGG